MHSGGELHRDLHVHYTATVCLDHGVYAVDGDGDSDGGDKIMSFNELKMKC